MDSMELTGHADHRPFWPPVIVAQPPANLATTTGQIGRPNRPQWPTTSERPVIKTSHQYQAHVVGERTHLLTKYNRADLIPTTTRHPVPAHPKQGAEA